MVSNRSRMWFGGKGYEEWVPAYARNADVSGKSFQSKSETVNSAAVIERSNYARKEYSLDFESNYQEELEVILDHARGTYGNILHFIDPSAAYRNLAPMDWAAPWLAIADAPIPLIPDQRPRAVKTPANLYRNPVVSARYTTNRPSERLYIPIPEGHTAWIGWRGTAEGTTSMIVTPFRGPEARPTARQELPPIDITSSLLFNMGIEYDANNTGFELSLKETGHDITIAALHIQILRNGRGTSTGRFIGGQGHTKLKVDGDPGHVVETAVRQRMNLSLNLTEVVE